MLAEAGHPELVAGLDADALSQAMPAILATIKATLAFRPAVGSATG